MQNHHSAIPERIIGLDLMRGLCALAVVAYHYLSWSHQFRIQSMGAFTVYAFFVLSGVTMMVVYGKRFGQEINRAALADFFQARVARLIPLLAFAAVGTFLLMVMFSGASPTDEAIKMVLTGTGIFSLGPPAVLSNVTGGWSLGIEGAFYLLFPTLALLLSNSGWRSLAVLGTALLIAQQLTIMLINRSGLPFWPLYVSVLTFSPFFLFGMAIAKTQRRLATFPLVAQVLCLAAICGFSLVLPETDIYSSTSAYVALTALSVAATLCAYNAKIPAFAKGAATFVGEISYSLYLTHWMSYVVAGKIASMTFGRGGVGEAVLFALLALVAAYASHIFVEVPAREFIKSRFKSRRAARPLVDLP